LLTWNQPNSQQNEDRRMTWLSEIEKIYQDVFRDTFENLGLAKYESKNGPGMGALMSFKNEFMRVRLLNDRGIVEIELSSIFGKEKFRDIELFNSFLILANTKHNLTKHEEQKILKTRLDYIGVINFLTQNKQNLERLLNKSNYKKTFKELDTIGQARYEY